MALISSLMRLKVDAIGMPQGYQAPLVLPSARKSALLRYFLPFEGPLVFQS